MATLACGLLVLLLTGCPVSPEQQPCSEGLSSDAGSCPTPRQAVSCDAGFEPRQGHPGCAPILPTADCAPGTMPVLGQRECQAVGWHDCDGGFEADPSGWGCREILPDAPCTGPTIERLGERSCMPIGDCNAPFPPPGAGYFVDDSYAAAQLDGRHFSRIAAAVAAAPAGAIVAVEEGHYSDSLQLARPITIAGRCAEKVVLQGVNPSSAGVMIGVRGVTLSGLTIAGFNYGVTCGDSGKATLRDAVISGNANSNLMGLGPLNEFSLQRCAVRDGIAGPGEKSGHGALLVDGAKLSAVDSVFTGNLSVSLLVTGSAGAVGSEVHLTRSLVSDTLESSVPESFGLVVEHGARAFLDQCVFRGNRYTGLMVNDALSSAAVHGSIIRGTLPRTSDGAGGFGLQSLGALTLESSALVENVRNGLALARDAGVATVSHCLIRDTQADVVPDTGWGIGATTGSTLTLDDSALVGNHGMGLMISRGATGQLSGTLVSGGRANPESLEGGRGISVQTGGHLRLSGCALTGNREAGLGVISPGSTAEVDTSVIAGTLPQLSDLTLGRGISLQDGAAVTVRRSVVRDNHDFGVLAVSNGARLELTDSLVEGTTTRVSDDQFGHGVAAVRGATAWLERTEVRASASVGLEFSASAAVVNACAVRENTIGLNAQDGSTVALRDGASHPTVGGTEVDISNDTTFELNQTRVGQGTLPLPQEVKTR